jgi:hypothetical protein
MFLASPMILCLMTGNFESLLFLFLSLFFFAFAKEKYKLASVFLAIAIAFKLYPAVFLLLFLKNKRYKECIYCVVLVMISTFCALLVLPPGGVIKNVHLWLDMFTRLNHVMAFAHGFYQTNTLFFIVQIAVSIYSIIRGRTETQYLAHLNHSVIYYYILAALMFVFLAIFILKYEKTYWKQVTVLFFCGMLLPTVSIEYKFINLFILIFLYINQPPKIAEQQNIIFNKIYLVLFSLLLIPKNYLIFTYYQLSDKSTVIDGVSPLLNIFIMLFFISLIIYDRIRIIRMEKIQPQVSRCN